MLPDHPNIELRNHSKKLAAVTAPMILEYNTVSAMERTNSFRLSWFLMRRITARIDSGNDSRENRA